jgi:hypothetical protein
MSLTDDELLAQALELREEARSLLYEKGLLDIVQTTGPACVIGSFALDLMTWRDLDISVQLPDENDILGFFDIGRKIIDEFQVIRMKYTNPVLHSDFPFDRGFYWGIRILHSGQTWKVDLWGYGEDDYHENLQKFARLSEQLKDGDRSAILRIKNEVFKRPEYRQEVISLDIYEAVTRHHIKTVKEFDEWIKHRSEESKDSV